MTDISKIPRDTPIVVITNGLPIPFIYELPRSYQTLAQIGEFEWMAADQFNEVINAKV